MSTSDPVGDLQTVRLRFVPTDLTPGDGDAAEREHPHEIAVLTLARPESANALSVTMLEELARAAALVERRDSVRAVVIHGEGKHFSAGADLAWMKESAALDFMANVADAERLLHAFEAIATLSVPTLAVVHGAAYGGAVGLVAACDFAIALDSARFCLSEIKLGLIPAVITPYLARRIPHGELRRLALGARIFDGQEAREVHLVQRVVSADQRDQCIREELGALLQGARGAQSSFKRLLDTVVSENYAQGGYTARAIAAARTGAEGQAGLAAFFAKQPAPWTTQLPPNWTIDTAERP